jgi:hypothetical protein
MDVFLPFQTQALGTGALRVPGQTRMKPSWRLVSSAPLESVTINDIRRSIEGAEVTTGPTAVATDEAWNLQQAATLAWENSWPADRTWWLRSRLEWTTLPDQATRTTTVGTPHWDFSRGYSAIRTMAGFVLPIGPVRRLPLAEIAVLGGISRTTLRSSGTRYNDPPLVTASSTQTVYRPVMLFTGSLALLRRPAFGVNLRAEAMAGPGFTANALIHEGTVLLPKHRITPFGLNIGLELYFPRF